MCPKKFTQKQSLRIHAQKCKPVTNSELPPEDPLEINTTKGVGGTVVDRWSEYLSCPKCGIEFDFDLELHLEVCQHPSKKNDEASASCRSLSEEGSKKVKNGKGTGGGADESMPSFKEEISEEPGDPYPVSRVIL